MRSWEGVWPKLLIIPSVASRSAGSVIASRSTAPTTEKTTIIPSLILPLVRSFAFLAVQLPIRSPGSPCYSST